MGQQSAESSRPTLSVVVASLGDAQLEAAVRSITTSARRGGIDVEVVVAWQGIDDAPALGRNVLVLDVFPFGLSHARNRGLAAARAPIVAFVDDDEVVHDDWAAAVVAAFELAPRPAGVFGPIEPLGTGFAYNERSGGARRVFTGAATPPWIVGSGGNMAFDREALLAVGGFDMLFGAGAPGRSGEDTELIARLLGAGELLSWQSEMVVFHPTKTESERLAVRFPYGYGMGKLVRRHRRIVLAAKYLASSGQAITRAVRTRDRRRRRESLATLRGFLAGATVRAEVRSPEDALDRLPRELAAALDGATVRPLEPVLHATPHLLYVVGDDRLLHVYVGPADDAAAALERRSHIRAASGVGGIPRVCASAAARDTLWVLEERLPGEHPPRGAAGRWFPTVADWAVAMAMPSGAPLGESAVWHEQRAALSSRLPGAALEALDDLPSVHVHGDLQRKNVLLARGRVGVVDWGGCELAGIPGRDLLFLATMARSDIPDPAIAEGLLAGGNPFGLRDRLGLLGVDGTALPHVVLVVAALWAWREEHRLAAPGMHGARIYARVLDAALRRYDAA